MLPSKLLHKRLLTSQPDEAVAFNWPDGTEDPANKMAMPGDNVEMVCETYNPVAVDQGQRFNVREGGRTVATGLVTRIIK